MNKKFEQIISDLINLGFPNAEYIPGDRMHDASILLTENSEIQISRGGFIPVIWNSDETEFWFGKKSNSLLDAARATLSQKL